jgi:hypothetical protein
MHTVSFAITRVQVIESVQGVDTVLLHTLTPSSFPHYVTGPLVLELTVEQGKGREYCQDTLGIPVELFDNA